MFEPFSPHQGLIEFTGTAHLAQMPGRKPKALVNPPNNLRAIRDAKVPKLTLTKAASDLGLKIETLRRYENGMRQLKAHYLKMFAEYYGVSQADITGDPSALSPRERALVNLFRSLPPSQQDTLHRLGSALAEPEAVVSKNSKRA